jgi:hypothetical protein
MAVQTQNVMDTYRDVGLMDLSALAARIFGLEDATNILKAGYDSAFYEREAALSNARSLQTSGQFAAKQGGLLGGIQMAQSGINFLKTFPFEGLSSSQSVQPTARSQVIRSEPAGYYGRSAGGIR